MNLLSGIVFLMSLLIEVKGESYYVSSHEATDWKTATEQCNLAEPELIYSTDDVHVDIPANIITYDVWIGYYVARTALEYFGCANVGSYTPAYITKADPGKCLSACGVDKVIGISGNKCFCFNKDENIGNGLTLFPNCDEICNDLYGIICGKSGDRDAYMSLYRSIGPHISSIGSQWDYSLCMYYNNYGFEWRGCYNTHGFICEKDNQTSTFTDRHTWTRATISCFEEGKQPSSYSNTKSIRATETKLWTGIVRSHVIYKYKSYQSLSKYAEWYVYISNEAGDLVVKAVKSSYILRKKLLCLNGNNTTTTSSTVTTTLAHVTSTEAKTSTTSPGSMQGTTYTHNVTHSTLQENNKGSSYIGLIVGASSSAMTVIVIAIVIIVVLRRRVIKERQPPHPMSVHNNNAYAMSATHQNQQNIDSQEEYADIDTATSAAAKAPYPNYSQGASYPYSNSGYEDGPCDTTESVNQKPDESGFNPYNHLDGFGEESPDYYNVGKGNTANAGRVATYAENMYNKTNLGFLKNSSIHKLGDFEMEKSDYDHIGKNEAKTSADVDNTYNTTNLGFLKTSADASDGIYNVTNTLDVDDEYSHTNAKKKHQTGFNVSENDYDTFKK